MKKKKPCRTLAKRVLGALPKGSISAALDVDILKGYTSLPKGSIYQILVKRFWLFFAGSFGQNGLNQQSLDQRDCAQTGVRLKKETVGGGVARLFCRVVLLSFLFLVSLFLGCLFVKGLDK